MASARTVNRRPFCDMSAPPPLGCDAELSRHRLVSEEGGILRAVFGLRAQELAEGLELVAADSALPKVMGETEQGRRRRGARQVELDPGGEELKALRAGDLLRLRLGDVAQQALDHAWVH